MSYPARFESRHGRQELAYIWLDILVYSIHREHFQHNNTFHSYRNTGDKTTTKPLHIFHQYNGYVYLYLYLWVLLSGPYGLFPYLSSINGIQVTARNLEIFIVFRLHNSATSR